jgi:hypothetical protein
LVSSDLVAGDDLVTGRATYGVRLWTPIAKGINRLRGNNRIPPGTTP